MIIYLAAAYARGPEMRKYRDILKKSGHTVTSRWIDQDEGTSDPTGLGPDTLDNNPECGAEFAIKDLEDIDGADTVLSFTGISGRGGRHVEFGMAYIMDKRLVIVGPREHVFHCFPSIEWYPDWDTLTKEWRLS